MDNGDGSEGGDSTDGGGDSTEDGTDNGEIILAEGTTPSGINYSDKIQKDMARRDWTSEQIDYAVTHGNRIDAIDKGTGESATRYIHPGDNRSVVINNNTNKVVQVGEPHFKFGPGSGDVSGAMIRPSPNARPGGGGGGGGLPASPFDRPGPMIRPTKKPPQE